MMSLEEAKAILEQVRNNSININDNREKIAQAMKIVANNLGR